MIVPVSSHTLRNHNTCKLISNYVDIYISVVICSFKLFLAILDIMEWNKKNQIFRAKNVASQEVYRF